MQNVSNSQLMSAIKRINQRLRDFEESGWTDTEQYEELLGVVNRLSKPARQTAPRTEGGASYTAIGITPKTATPLDIDMIMNYGVHMGSKSAFVKTDSGAYVGLTKGQAIKSALREFVSLNADEFKGMNKKQIQDYARKYRKNELKVIASENKRVHDFIIQHADDIYNVNELAMAVHRSTKLTPAEREKLLHMYENPEYLEDDGTFRGDSEEVIKQIMSEGQK